MGIQPSEFWGMTLQEFYILYDMMREKDPQTDYAGGMTETTAHDLWRDLMRRR